MYKLDLSFRTGDSEDKCFRDALTIIQMLDFIRNGDPLVILPMRSVGEIYAHMPNDVTELKKIVVTLINGGVCVLYDQSPLTESAQELLVDSVEELDDKHFITLEF